MKKLMIGIVILALLAAIGVLMFYHFVTNRVTDIGGMEATEYAQNEY